MRRLRLDQVWLLVSPGNPLKTAAGMAPFAQRLRSAQALADGRRIVATGIELRLGTLYTVDTLRLLRRRFPLVAFVWLMGADNLAQFSRWSGWLQIARTVPFAVLPRPRYIAAALTGQAAQRLGRARLPAGRAASLAGAAAPAWVFLPGRLHAASATAIRADNRRLTTIARKPPEQPPPADPPATPAGSPARMRPAPRASNAAGRLAITAPPKPGTPRKKAAIAGPASQAPVRERAELARLDQLQKIIVDSLEGDKAEDVVALDLAGRAAFADRMVIATGLADRQIAAMATHLEDKLHDAGLKRVQIEGASGSDWVLIDAGDIVVHLFKPDARALYALERMWGAELDEAPS